MGPKRQQEPSYTSGELKKAEEEPSYTSGELKTAGKDPKRQEEPYGILVVN